MSISEYQWTARVTKHEVVTEHGAHGHVTDQDQKWRWEVIIPMPHGGAVRLGNWVESIEVAKLRVEETLRIADQILALSPFFLLVNKEVPTEKVDIVEHGLCLLCSKDEVSSCLHTQPEVRLAFRLALRLGRHRPEQNR